jgi:CHAT domain-containing protein
MSWAFFGAGTHSLLVSQWKVNSASTSKLTTSFYDSLKTAPSDRRKAFALQEASLSLLKDNATRHLFYWAGFVMPGSAN